jgi:CRISPR-associated protein Csx17
VDEQTLELEGCAPTPLMSYLKALGVLRVVATQKGPTVRGYWRGGKFCLVGVLGREALFAFFLKDYEPAPVIGPWNNSSGFSPPDAEEKEELAFIKQSGDKRLAPYQETITRAEEAVQRLGIQVEKIGEDNKRRLVSELRRRLPDEALQWLDAVLVLGTDQKGAASLGFPPLLGTGGNDGAMNFTVNYMARLREVLTDNRSRGWLEDALFGCASTPAVRKKIGFFAPSAGGGANTDQGFEGSSIVNPWDFVLMIEGTLFFAGSVSRRQAASGAPGRAAFPFTVNSTAAGYVSAAQSDEEGFASRGEIWVPLWERPAGARELARLFSEGRARLGRRPARDGLDFTRAVASLGTSRGISGFVRYGMAKRRGDAYIATPLGFYRSREAPVEGIELLNEVDTWLSVLERVMSDSAKEMPHGLRAAIQGVKESMHNFAVHGGTRYLQGVLAWLGRAELALAKSTSLRSDGKIVIRPLTLSSPAWVSMCDDGSPEFRVAVAVASILPVGQKLGPFRTEMESVSLERGYATWHQDSVKTVPLGEDLPRLLATVIRRRCLVGSRLELEHPPLAATSSATLDDVRLFLAGLLDERKVLSLLPGLVLLRPSAFTKSSRQPADAPPTLPRDYVLLKAHFLPGLLRWSGEEIRMSSEAALIPLLRAGRVPEACRLAERRLHFSGLISLGSFGEGGLDGERLLASLLIPVAQRSFESTALPMVLRKETKLAPSGGKENA